MAELIFHPDTALEIKESYEWYQQQAEGLGDDFLKELESAFEAIARLPGTWPKFTLNCRRFVLKKFPFSIIYQARDEAIFIVAIMHNSRKPGYWKDRA